LPCGPDAALERRMAMMTEKHMRDCGFATEQMATEIGDAICKIIKCKNNVLLWDSPEEQRNYKDACLDFLIKLQTYFKRK
jgi:hypothetical protein